MTGPSHGDIQRDIGGLEKGQQAMEKRLDRLEKLIEDRFLEIRKDIADLKVAESQRKGALAVLVAVGGVIGGAIWAVIEHFWK